MTLAGPGGCGKTRLAIEVGLRFAERVRDGAIFVDLAALQDESLVAQQVASVLGLPQVPGRAPLDALLGALAQRQLLLVLDNCEHLLAACATLVGAILASCSEVTVLTTTRALLGLVAESVWQVPPLSLPPWDDDAGSSDAVRLFVARAETAAPEFALTAANVDAVVRVCRGLDGIPLAIELAAARVRSLGIRELGARLDLALDVLASADSSRPRRQQTLQATLAWSADLLTPAERALFAELSVFSGGWTLAAAEAVCCIDASDERVVDLVLRLVDRSLVMAMPQPDGSMRYRLLDVVRQYAAQQLRSSGDPDEVRRRHAEYFAARLASTWPPAWWGPGVDQRLAWVESEVDNLRAALRWLVDAGAIPIALRVGYSLSAFWLLSSRVVEGRAWLSEIVGAASPGLASAEYAGARVWLGALLAQEGNYARGRAVLEEALGLARSVGDALALDFALMWLAIIAHQMQDAPAALAFATEGVALSRRSGQRALEAMDLRMLAQIAIDRGEFDGAWRLASAALAAGREAEHPPSIAWALTAMGLVALRRGEFASALHLFDESVARGAGMIAAAIQQATIVYAAWAALELGDVDQAILRARQALSMAKVLLGGRGFLALPLEAFAQIAVERGAFVDAVVLAAAADARRVEFHAPRTPTQSAQLARRLERARGRLGPSVASAVALRGSLLSDAEAVALCPHT